jgi:molybdopterin-guanine dinucleotide biosynthesis adapter protein
MVSSRLASSVGSMETTVLGISGWSGSGKTALITRLIPLLQKRGLRVAVIKRAHHDFDIDIPGKDSFEHRAAGAVEVIIASARRVAQITELQDAPAPRLADLLRRASACDLVLIEGFKAEVHPKFEVFRSKNGTPPLHPADPATVAVASDTAFPDADIPCVDIDDIEAIADIVVRSARSIKEVIERLEGHGPAQ